MNLAEAIDKCHVRAAVVRKSHPHIKFWKNNQEPLLSRIPTRWQSKKDWIEYDPRDDDDTSLFSFND